VNPLSLFSMQLGNPLENKRPVLFLLLLLSSSVVRFAESHDEM